MEIFNYLNEYYSNYDEEGRLASRHGQVEFLTTMSYIKRYLKPGVKILEIGSGTGRYSLSLAKMGYKVDAVELIPHNIDIFKSKITNDMDISVVEGNAINLGVFEDELYDITLLLGPMYHLYDKKDQLTALKEALRVTKKHGILCTAYCMMDASILSYGFIGGNVEKLIEKVLLDTKEFIAKSTPSELFQLYRKERIEELTSQLNIKRLHFVGTDMYTNHMRSTVDAMDDDRFDIYLKYHYAICERPDMIGLTHHSLDIVQKL